MSTSSHPYGDRVAWAMSTRVGEWWKYPGPWSYSSLETVKTPFPLPGAEELRVEVGGSGWTCHTSWPASLNGKGDTETVLVEIPLEVVPDYLPDGFSLFVFHFSCIINIYSKIEKKDRTKILLMNVPSLNFAFQIIYFIKGVELLDSQVMTIFLFYF